MGSSDPLHQCCERLQRQLVNELKQPALYAVRGRRNDILPMQHRNILDLSEEIGVGARIGGRLIGGIEQVPILNEEHWDHTNVSVLSW